VKGVVVIEPGRFQILSDIPKPKLGPYNCTVENIACGICNGTDPKIINGHLGGFQTYPAVLGHETIGRVVELGTKVRNFVIGDLVLRSMLYDIGSKYYSLWGGFSEYGTVYDYKAMIEDSVGNIDPFYQTQQIVPKDFDIDLAQATMLITLKEVMSGLERLAFREGMTTMIVGCGPVGLSMVNLCRIMGAKYIVAMGHHQSRLDKAKQLGADLVINTKTTDEQTAVINQFKQSIDLFIDAVGNNDVILLGLQVIKSDGKVGIYGIPNKNKIVLEYGEAQYNWEIKSVQWPVAHAEARVHNKILNNVKNGRICLSDFVTHVISFDDFARGIDLVSSREGLKVVVNIH